MGKRAHDDDYEYGFDYLYEEEKPADAAKDAGGPDDEDDEPDDTGDMESVLAMERIMREVNVKPLDLDIPEDTHGMLKREAKAEALRRCGADTG